MINVKVRLFANLRENRDKEMMIELGEGSTIKDIIEILNISREDAAILLVNGLGAELDKILEDNDTVSIFPPLGGG